MWPSLKLAVQKAKKANKMKRQQTEKAGNPKSYRLSQTALAVIELEARYHQIDRTAYMEYAVLSSASSPESKKLILDTALQNPALRPYALASAGAAGGKSEK